ncbi:MAG: hypothetical protein LBM98_02245 [Oscillospiraceae bacterium]|nr:hypothetical protein [Oscillospiraceae bacterium]
MRYVQRIGTKQSSAGSVTYVCCPSGTGLLRTCNALRIAGLPVLRKDGARRRDVRRRGTMDGGRGRWTVDVGLDGGTGLGLLRAARNDGLGLTPRPRRARPPSKPSKAPL